MKAIDELKAALAAVDDEKWDWGDLCSSDGDNYAEIRTTENDPTILFQSCGPESEHSKNVDRAFLVALMRNTLPALIECAEALPEIIRISDRKHDAWDRAKAALAKLENN